LATLGSKVVGTIRDHHGCRVLQIRVGGVEERVAKGRKDARAADDGKFVAMVLHGQVHHGLARHLLQFHNVQPRCILLLEVLLGVLLEVVGQLVVESVGFQSSLRAKRVVRSTSCKSSCKSERSTSCKSENISSSKRQELDQRHPLAKNWMSTTPADALIPAVAKNWMSATPNFLIPKRSDG
jgi:hypothetical protein